MIPDPVWCAAHPVRCHAETVANREAWQGLGTIVGAGMATVLLLVLARELAREGRYRPALGATLAAVTVAVIGAMIL